MFKNIAKKTISGFIICLFILTSAFSFGLFLNISSKKTAFAASDTNDIAIDVPVTNGSFEQAGSGKPAAVNNFIKQNGSNSASVKNGIITTFDSTTTSDNTNTFKTNAKEYGLPADKNPGAAHINTSTDTDYNVLMLNNLDTNGTTSPASIGYKTETPLTLEANTFYQLTIYAKCYESASFSIYLDEITEEKDTQKLNLKHETLSVNDWQSFNFFIQTSNIYDITANLELWLGSKQANDQNSTTIGAVFFDSISLSKLTAEQYNTQLTVTSDTPKQSVDLTNPKSINDNIENNNFDFETKSEQNKISGWNIPETVGGNFNAQAQQTLAGFNFNEQTLTVLDNRMHKTEKNEQIALLYIGGKESDENKSFGSIVSKEFTIKQQGIYRVSFFARVNTNVAASAKLNIVKFLKNGKDVNELETKKTSTISMSSTLDRPISNNYLSYSFIVYGHQNFDTVLNLEFGLGSAEAKTFGYAFIDDVNVEKLNFAEATLGSGKSTRFDIPGYSEEGLLIKNPYFNSADKIELTENTKNGEVSYPIKSVKDWTYASEPLNKNNLIYGMVDTNRTHFDSNILKYKTGTYPVLAQPGQIALDSTNNVLLLNNTSYASYQGYTSSAYSLESNNYYKVFVDALRNKEQEGDAYLIVKSGDNVLAKINLISNGKWQTNTIYIKTALRKADVNFELALGTSLTPAKGDVFFDNIGVESITKDVFDNLTNSSATFDWSKETFDIKGSADNTYSYLYGTPSFSGSSTDDTTFGTYNLQDPNLPDYLKVGSVPNNYKDNILYIENNTFTSFNATGSLNYNVESGKYYKLSVFAKTSGIQCEDGFRETDDLKYGLKISLNGIDKNFNAIKSTDNYDGYVEYSFYISSNAAKSLNFNITFGEEVAKIKGRVFINLMSAEEITVDEFTKNTAFPSPDEHIKIITILDTTEKTPEDTQTPPATPFDWFLIPTIIMSLTLIIVIIGVGVQNIKWQKRKKASKIEYDATAAAENQLNESILSTRKNRRLAKKDNNKTAENKILDTNNSTTDLENSNIDSPSKELSNQDENVSTATSKPKVTKKLDKTETPTDFHTFGTFENLDNSKEPKAEIEETKIEIENKIEDTLENKLDDKKD